MNRQEKERLAKLHNEMLAAYIHRQRSWVMECLPTMPDEHWHNYITWVTSYSFVGPQRNTRKTRRRLTRDRGMLREREVWLKHDLDFNRAIAAKMRSAAAGE